MHCNRCLSITMILMLWAAPWVGSHAQPGAPPVVVGIAEQAALIDEVPLTGTVTSPRVAKLSAEVSGLVKSIRVEEGDRVEAGDVLLTLDPELDQLSLEAARAATEQAQHELADAKRRLVEAERLAPQKSIPVTALRSLEAEVRIDGSTLQRFTAEQRRHEARLRRRQVPAPFAGVIVRKMTETGEWIEPGDTVVELIATEGLRIDFQVPQRVFPKVTSDTEVRVHLDAFSQQTFNGKISAIVPVSDPSARTFLMRVTLDATDVAMTPGMSAHGVLRLRTGHEGIVVPRDALLRYPDGRVTVWVVNGDGDSPTVSEHRVQTGLGFDGRVAVLEGLEAGSRIVIEGNEVLQDGQTVTIHRQE